MNDYKKNYSVEIDSIEEAKWEELLLEFEDANIHQTWSAGKINWGEQNLSHLVLKRNGKVRAMAQVSIKQLSVVRAGVATVYWGPLWRRSGKQEEYDVLEKVIKALKNEYSTKRGFLLRVWPIGFQVLEKRTISILEKHGFKHNSKIFPYRTILLNLSPPLEELRKNLSQNWRRKLKIAEKKNLNVLSGSSSQFYQNFLKMLNEMINRKNFEARVDYDAYGRIQSELPESLKMKIFVCGFEGNLVSAIVVSAMGKNGIYLLGATANKGLSVNGSYLLHWSAIKWLKEKGCLCYDLGGIDPTGNPGVYHFKLGLSGKKGMDVNHIGQFYLAENLTGHLLRILIDQSNYVRSKFGKKLKSIYEKIKFESDRIFFRRSSAAKGM